MLSSANFRSWSSVAAKEKWRHSRVTNNSDAIWVVDGVTMRDVHREFLQDFSGEAGG